jgi:hypothetical protein
MMHTVTALNNNKKKKKKQKRDYTVCSSGYTATYTS